MVLLLVCLALGVFLYMKHKQNQREVDKRNRLEEKQEELMEILRKRKSE
jgi:hypothetical protein